jgi:hypothetical protein
LVVAYFTIDIVRNTVNRSFVNDSGSTAIAGRVRRTINHMKKMSARDLIIGYSKDVAVSEFEFNTAGFFATLFKQGIIGVILSYWFYLRGLRNLHSANFWYTLVIVALSFFTAHTHGTFYMLFFVCFQMYGYATEGAQMRILPDDFAGKCKNTMVSIWQKILLWFKSKRGNIKK